MLSMLEEDEVFRKRKADYVKPYLKVARMEFIRNNDGKMPNYEIAEELGISMAYFYKLRKEANEQN